MLKAGHATHDAWLMRTAPGVTQGADMRCRRGMAIAILADDAFRMVLNGAR